MGDSQIIHIDDFYKLKDKRIKITEQTQVHSNFEFERLKHQVLEPLGYLTAASYRTVEGNKIEVKPQGYIVVEGLGTLGNELRDYFDFKIWIDTPESVRRQRGIERDSEVWIAVWDEEYLPQDARYVKEQTPQNFADYILNNS